MDDTIDCGERASQEFSFEPGWTNFNHGSFGTVPSCVDAVQMAYQRQLKTAPDLFIRYTFPPLLNENRKAIAEHLSVDTADVVFVPNATTGIDTILRNLVFQQGDVCLYFSTVYNSIERQMIYKSETSPLVLHKIDLVYPIEDAEIVRAFDDTVDKVRSAGLRPKLAIFDTISSVPGVAFPTTLILQRCRANSILSMVDAAQGAGQMELSITELDPDFLVTNLHKWLFVPRPCAILYVPKRNQHLIRSSLPTSSGFVPRDSKDINNPLPSSGALSPFEANFAFVGTLDSTAYLCIIEALRWRKRLRYGDKLGEDAIYQWLSDSAKQAGQIVSGRLGTSVMRCHDTLRYAFANVELPIQYSQIFGGKEPVEFGKVLGLARWMEERFVKRFSTFILIYWHDGRFWTRLSAQVYLVAEDWEKAGLWLEEICREAMTSYTP